MATKKNFDCVEMKNRIQAQIMEEDRGLSEEEIRQRRQHMLETSDSLVARKWREIREYRDQENAKATLAK